jgi:hypothetical protein
MMAVAQCPHCGELNLTITGWADLDRCVSCGKPLASHHPHLARDRVQEQMALDDRATGRARELTSKRESR